MREAVQGLALASLEQLINRALALDPASVSKLAALGDRRFALLLQEPELSLTLSLTRGQVQLASGTSGTPVTTRLSGRWQDFATIASADDPGAALINGDVTLQGDTQALLDLRRILADLNLDWEQPLANAFGDVVGHQIGRGLRRSQNWLLSSSRHLQRQAEEFLLEESRLLPHPVEASAFFDDVDTLRSHSERLDARLRRLQQRLGALHAKSPRPQQ